MIERIGIIGGGQLGRMMTPPAKELGFGVTVVENDYNCPAAQVGAEVLKAPITDESAIEQLSQISGVTTWEIEHIPTGVLEELKEAGHNIQADPATLAIIQDKLVQSYFLQDLGIPVAPFSDTLDESNFVGGGPFVVKSRRGGYDGRGNLVVDKLDDPKVKEQFGDNPIYVEQKLDFDKELAVVAARDTSGNIVTYQVVETIHENNICHTVISPAEINPKLREQAEQIARETLKHLNGAGVFAIEMFVVGDNVLVNEIAPRVHNSGHLTIEASETSQFEQSVRAITGLPLGSTEQAAPAAVMVNILGTKEGPLDRTGINEAAALPDTKVHFYGKTPRFERKIGHITTLAANTHEALATAKLARSYFKNL
jgi:phosphoribosylaminoimidazole carboxylase PurK protein